MTRAWVWASLLLPWSGALSGCLDPDCSYNMTTGTDSSSTLPSVRLDGTLAVTNCRDGERTIDGDVGVRNTGSVTYQYRDGCGNPWQVGVYHQGRGVDMSEPGVSCQAFQWKTLGASGSLEHDVLWDGRQWNATSNQLVPSPAGNYTMIVRFPFYATEHGPSDSVEFRSEFVLE